MYKQLGTGHVDQFQTPPVAIQPLIPYLRCLTAAKNRANQVDDKWAKYEKLHVWESACGKGNLVSALSGLIDCLSVTGSDISDGRDTMTWQPDLWDVMVTNPPFSIKDQWIERCYELGKPFALLMPLTALEGQRRQSLYREHGIEVILLNRRIHFETPSGRGSGSWFPSAWFCWKFGIAAEGHNTALTFGSVASSDVKQTKMPL